MEWEWWLALFVMMHEHYCVQFRDMLASKCLQMIDIELFARARNQLSSYIIGSWINPAHTTIGQ